MHAAKEKFRVDGQIAPERLYTREGCRRYAGLSREALLKAKQSGIVTPILCERRVYFRGSELIAWIESHAHAIPKE